MDLNILLPFVIVCSYVLLQSIEFFSFGSRVAGKSSGDLSLGFAIQQTIFTISRSLLMIFLPALAFSVESKISVETYLLVVCLSLFITAVVSFYFINRLNAIQLFFQTVFFHYDTCSVPKAFFRAIFGTKNHIRHVRIDTIFSFENIQFKNFLLSFIAYSFLVSGFFVAFLFAIMFYEYRLTFSQMTPIFHGVGALIVAFFLDPMLSRSIDRSDDESIWLKNVYSVMLGRALGYVFACIVFIVILWLV